MGGRQASRRASKPFVKGRRAAGRPAAIVAAARMPGTGRIGRRANPLATNRLTLRTKCPDLRAIGPATAAESNGGSGGARWSSTTSSSAPERAGACSRPGSSGRSRRQRLPSRGGRERQERARSRAAGFRRRCPIGLNTARYETVPQPQLDGRRGFQPRGRVLGGSTSINAMVIPAARRRLRPWAAQGNAGWDYASVLPLFKRSENRMIGEDAIAASAGRSTSPICAAPARSTTPFSPPAPNGRAPNPDYNGARQEGYGPSQVMQVNGERCSAAKAFSRPILGDPTSRRDRGAGRQHRSHGWRATGVSLLVGANGAAWRPARSHPGGRLLWIAAVADAFGIGRAAICRRWGSRSFRPSKASAKICRTISPPLSTGVRRAADATIGFSPSRRLAHLARHCGMAPQPRGHREQGRRIRRVHSLQPRPCGARHPTWLGRRDCR